MNVCMKNGELMLVRPDGTPFFRHITAQVTALGKACDLLTFCRTADWTLKGNVASSEDFTLEFIPEGEGMLIRGTFTNNTGKTIDSVEAIHFIHGDATDVPRKAFCTRVFKVAGNRISDMRSSIDTVHVVPGARYDSPDFTAFTTDRGSTVFGFVTYRECFGGVTLNGDGHLSLHHTPTVCPIAPGETVTSDLFCIMPYGDIVTEALPAYAELVLAHSGGRRPVFSAPVGFCTWYYYGKNITDETLRENMAVLEAHKEDIPVNVIQIDDGWYSRWGDLVPLGRFHGGDMKGFADEVKEKGWIPGIWVAPLGVDPDSDLRRVHPEYLVKNPDGSDWKNPFMCLDLSVPGAAEYVANLFRTLSYEWGYRYVKFDIVSDTLGAGVFRDPKWNPLKNYRRLLELARANVTEDTFLLACTVPLNATAGLADGLRVSCDVFERWDSILDVFNPTLKRYFMNGVWFCNDGDCLLVRTADEEDSECFRPCTRTPAEIRTFATAMAASGGTIMFSDKLSLLKPWQWELLSKLYPINRTAAIPLDLMDSYIPGVLDFGVRHGIRTVALINWGDAPRTFTVPDSCGKLAFEFWAQEFLGLIPDDLSFEIPPHETRVVFLADPDGDRVLVGTDASIVMDIKDGKPNKPGERLFYAVKRDGIYQPE